MIQELKTKLEGFNKEFYDKMAAIDGTFIYYSNRNNEFTIDPLGTQQESSDQRDWRNSTQYMVLQVLKEQYRDAIIQTKSQLKITHARDPETILEYLSEYCRKFFNYIDNTLKILFKLKYTMDERGNPFAYIIRQKPNFFNRLAKHDSNLSQEILSLEKLDNSIDNIHFDLNEMPAALPKKKI